MTQDQLEEENYGLRQRVAAQERLIASLQADSNSPGAAATKGKKRQRDTQAGGDPTRIKAVGGEASTFQDAITSPEHGPDIIENEELQIFGFSNSPAVGASSTRNTWTTSGERLFDLVPLDKSAMLVDAHFRFLDWIHCVVHEPTFRQEHELW